MNKHQFLSRLLTTSNRVRTHKGQECPICKEEFNTSPSFKNENTEVQIRLPCNPMHTVGSTCIATWLRDHNTCPICRCEFFPAETRKPEVIEDLYIVDIESDDEGSARGDESEDEDFRYENGETDAEDENMSDEEESASEEDEDGDRRDRAGR